MSDRPSGVELPATRGPAGSQATTIEQTRAAEQVRAAVYVAQTNRRNPAGALTDILDACRVPALAQRAFFRFPRGGEQITGPSIHLATELARLWGNLDYGIFELARDDGAGVSEMLAVAWDLQANVRVSAGFLVPHAMDTKKGRKQLTDLRDVYENNANNGARRVRECIFRVLPAYVREAAEDECRKTIESGGGRPLVERIRDAIEGFRGLGVTEDDIARKLRRPAGDWTAYDLADLAVIFGSLKRGEVRRDDEFPPPNTDPVTPDQIATGRGRRDTSTRALFGLLGRFGLAAEPRRADRLALLSELVDRPIGSSAELTPDEVTFCADQLQQWAPDPKAEPSEDSQLIVAELITRGRERTAAEPAAEQ